MGNIFFLVAMTGTVYVIDTRKFQTYANSLMEKGEKLRVMGDKARGYLVKIDILIEKTSSSRQYRLRR